MHDAVILAGGRGTRLGGVDKAAVELGGEPLIAASLAAAADARSVVVVGSTSTPLPAGIRVTQEEPAGAGPAAAFLQGLHVIEAPAEWTLLLSCDVPGAPHVPPRLVAAVVGTGSAGAARDGAVLVDPDGRRQWTLGLYRREAIIRSAAQLSSAAGMSLRALLGPLEIVEIPAVGDEWRDVDTWDDHSAWSAARVTRAARTADDG